MEIVTGYKGQAHITAENWADLNRGIIGSDSYVLSVGREFESELVSNNLLKIHDGTAMIQGRQFVIPSGQSDEITIENGTQGENRTDLIVARYTKNNDTKVEEVAPVYIKGTPSASDPVLPDYNTDGDIRAGDLTADMPLYALDLEGINVVAVRPLFNILKNAAQLNSELCGDVLYEDNSEYFNPTTSSTTYKLNGSINRYKKLLVQGINNNGIRFWSMVSTIKGTGVPGTTVDALFSLTLVLPISQGTTAAVWFQSSIFSASEDGTEITSGAGCQLRLGQSPSQERKHYLGITKVIGLM